MKSLDILNRGTGHYHPTRDARPSVLILYSYSESAEEVAKALRNQMAAKYTDVYFPMARRYTYPPGRKYDVVIYIGTFEEDPNIISQRLADMSQWFDVSSARYIETYTRWKRIGGNSFLDRDQWLKQQLENLEAAGLG